MPYNLCHDKNRIHNRQYTYIRLIGCKYKNVADRSLFFSPNDVNNFNIDDGPLRRFEYVYTIESAHAILSREIGVDALTFEPCWRWEKYAAVIKIIIFS